MVRGLPFLLLALAAALPARAQPPQTVMPQAVMPQAVMPQTVMDVAPTTLELLPNRAGLFFVTNHGARPVTVQIEAMDWRQQATGGDGRDRLTPSTTLLTSPPMARIAPGARQSVRVLARGAAAHERAFRLLVSQLPDAADESGGVRVLLQFSVPVFVGHDPHAAPQLRWAVENGVLSVRNTGVQTVKLENVRVNGTVRGALSYLLPEASQTLGPVTGSAHVTAHDGRSGRDLSAVVSAPDARAPDARAPDAFASDARP